MTAAARTWQILARRWRSRFQRKALVLMYHRVGESTSDPFAISVSPRNFAEQMQVLQRYSHPLPLLKLSSAAQSGKIRPRSVAVTFDDGYADNLHTAKPLLARYGIPATVFVATGYLDKQREFWWDELARVLEPGTLPDTLWLTIEGARHHWELGAMARYQQSECDRHRRWRAEEQAPTPRHSLYFSLWRLVQLLPENDRRHILDEVLHWSGGSRQSRDNYRTLTPQEVVTLEKGGLVEVGAHTVTHPALRELSAGEQRNEIEQSKLCLEKILGHAVTTFTYPYGARNDETVAIVRDLRFTCACAASDGVVQPGADWFQFPRMQVCDWDGDQFERRLSAWFDSSAEVVQ